MLPYRIFILTLPLAPSVALPLICQTMSVFVSPAASDLVMEAAIEDIVDKLERGAELLETGAIAMALLSTSTANAGVQSAIASP